MKELMTEHPEIFVIILAFLLTAINILGGSLGWFIVRTLGKINQNQDKLFGSCEALAEKLNELIGEHRVYTAGMPRHGKNCE